MREEIKEMQKNELVWNFKCSEARGYFVGAYRMSRALASEIRLLCD